MSSGYAESITRIYIGRSAAKALANKSLHLGGKECVTIYEKMARRRSQRKGYLREDNSGNWLLTYRVYGPNGPERVTVTVARSTGPDAIGKREAQRLAWTEYLSKLDTMSLRPSSSSTFREFVEQRFMPDVVANLKKGGQIHYRVQLQNHILPSVGEKPLREITPALIQSLLNAKLKEGLSTQSVVHLRNAISAVMRHARDMDWFAGRLPTEAVRLPTMKRKERRALTWEQVCMIARALPEPISTLTVMLTLTGLRISEAMGLRWKWVNLTPDLKVTDGEVIPPYTIAVRESYRYGQYQTVKSQRSRRDIPIPKWFAGVLLKHGESVSRLAESPVFANSTGLAPLDAHNITNRILRPTLAKLGLKGIGFHNLRVTNATLADQAGATVTQSQRILGHASTDMTLHYQKADLDRMRPLLEAMVDKTKLN